MSKIINIGVVGCGYWGPNLIRNFHSLPRCRMKWMCDANPMRLKHLKTLYPSVEGLLDYEEMLKADGLDAVVIATSVRSHFPMAKASLMAGKHTFIEKPMAASVAECEELVDLAESKGLTLMIGHTFLYSPAVRRMKELLARTHDMGAIQYICSRRLNLGLFQKDINVTWDLAPHDISIILYLLEESPVSINCRGNAHVTPGVEDVTSLCMNFRRGPFAMVHNSWLDPRKVREMTIVCAKRMIVYDDIEPLEKIKIYDTRVETPPHYDTFAEFQCSYHYGDIYTPYLKQEEPLKVECQHFLDCIIQGEEPLSSGRQGMELVRVLEAASLSLKRHGAVVDLRPVHHGRAESTELLGANDGNGHDGNGHAGNGHSDNGTKGHAPARPGVATVPA
jgi:predicted dehydrogenase